MFKGNYADVLGPAEGLHDLIDILYVPAFSEKPQSRGPCKFSIIIKSKDFDPATRLVFFVQVVVFSVF